MKAFSIPDEEVKLIEEGINLLRKRDLWSESKVVVEALKEYIQKHSPGNPGLPLDHWTKNLPFSEAAQEKLKRPLGTEKCETCGGYGWIQHER